MNQTHCLSDNVMVLINVFKKIVKTISMWTDPDIFEIMLRINKNKTNVRIIENVIENTNEKHHYFNRDI